MSHPPHARAFDLPSWPCPPRVRDIPGLKHSWGAVAVGERSEHSGVIQDELGRLWANGDQAPRFDVPNQVNNTLIGGVLFWTEEGLGVYVHPQRYRYLPSLNFHDMAPDRWVPIASTTDELPDFVQLHSDADDWLLPNLEDDRTRVVWVVYHWDRHDYAISLWSSQAKAKGYLASYVTGLWEDISWREGVPHEPPPGDQEAIDLYYGPTDKWDDEGYTIFSQAVDDA